MKKVLIAVAVVAVIGVVLIGVLIGGAFMMKDKLVKTGVEKGGTFALGTPVTLQEASLTLKTGNLTLTGLDVANPEGFTKASHITQIGEISVQLDPQTATSDLVVIDHATVDGLALNLELDKENTPNFQPILDRINELTAGDGTEEPKEKAPSDMKVKISLIKISDLVVTLRMDTAGGGVGERVLKLPDFEANGIGDPDGLPPEKLQGVLTKAVMEHVKNSAGDLLPQVMLAGLQAGLDNLAGLGDVSVTALGDGVEQLSDNLGPAIEQANEVFTGLGDQAGQALEEGGKALEDGGKKAQEALDGALKGLSNPFGGKKEGE